MTKIHVLARGDGWSHIVDWLESYCQVDVNEIASRIYYPAEPCEGPACQRKVAITGPGFDTIVNTDDVVIVCGDKFNESLADLLSRGITNVYNGNEALQRSSAAARFLARASFTYTGPNTPVGPGLPTVEAARFSLAPLEAANVPKHKLFIVNSIPKSGTVWMSAMLEALLKVKARTQITISHVADIEQDWNKVNNHGAVALVRDLRDVVVSWFHNAYRTDLSLGFAQARYPDIETFYYQHFLGTISATDRFYRGNLIHWIDLVSANYIPVLRYEDMVTDTRSCLEKVMNAWQIEVGDAELDKAVQKFNFDDMKSTVKDNSGFVGTMVREGHLRQGKVGGWTKELPSAIADDISRRFSDYQHRLGYA